MRPALAPPCTRGTLSWAGSGCHQSKLPFPLQAPCRGPLWPHLRRRAFGELGLRRMESVFRLDERLTDVLQRLAFGPLDFLVLPGAVLFGWEGIGPVLISVFLLGGQGALYLALLALAAGQITNRGLKVLLQRQRPTPPPSVTRRARVRIPGPDDPDGPSFPSGDTMAGSAVGGALALAGAGSAWWLLGLYAGFARVYFWCHFVLDVLCGYLVGSSAALLVALLSGGGAGLRWWHILLAVPPFAVLMKTLKRLQAAKHAEGSRG
uniref:Phosphatidic acid phosphatase type 2/haloperoxidase domain-containing protein n=1 Tax=Alexandrium monilatum TaxID=311494 RepID=A0A7S4VYM5_9DINO|mmetsp:Transcript_6457/g.20345  ORF Transcript_6457/g.20345 Transcript_6457/m.20345 type:complete len:264 (+) Transcript_6457:25-816(+)